MVEPATTRSRGRQAGGGGVGTAPSAEDLIQTTPTVDTLKDSAHRGIDKSANVAHNLVESVGDRGADAIETASSVGQAAKESVSRAAQSAGQYADAVRGQAAQAVGSAKEAVRGTAAQVVSGAKEAVSAVPRAAHDVSVAAQEALPAALPSLRQLLAFPISILRLPFRILGPIAGWIYDLSPLLYFAGLGLGAFFFLSFFFGTLLPFFTGGPSYDQYGGYYNRGSLSDQLKHGWADTKDWFRGRGERAWDRMGETAEYAKHRAEELGTDYKEHYRPDLQRYADHMKIDGEYRFNTDLRYLRRQVRGGAFSNTFGWAWDKILNAREYVWAQGNHMWIDFKYGFNWFGSRLYYLFVTPFERAGHRMEESLHELRDASKERLHDLERRAARAGEHIGISSERPGFGEYIKEKGKEALGTVKEGARDVRDRFIGRRYQQPARYVDYGIHPVEHLSEILDGTTGLLKDAFRVTTLPFSFVNGKIMDAFGLGKGDSYADYGEQDYYGLRMRDYRDRDSTLGRASDVVRGTGSFIKDKISEKLPSDSDELADIVSKMQREYDRKWKDAKQSVYENYDELRDKIDEKRQERQYGRSYY